MKLRVADAMTPINFIECVVDWGHIDLPYQRSDKLDLSLSCPVGLDININKACLMLYKLYPLNPLQNLER